VVKLLCSVDLDSRSGSEGANRKVKATLHWLSDLDAVPFEARLYEPILMDDAPEEEIEIDEEGAEVEKPDKDFMSRLNPNSLTVMKKALCDKDNRGGGGRRALPVSCAWATSPRTRTPPRKSRSTNRIVPLKDSWQKVKKRLKPSRKILLTNLFIDWDRLEALCAGRTAGLRKSVESCVRALPSGSFYSPEAA
jgi:hypothetical protein